MGKSYRELEYEIEGNIGKIARLKNELAKLEKDYKLLEKYYEAALEQLSNTAQKMAEVERKAEILQEKNARLEGQLDRTKNAIRILSGRENW